MSIGLRALENPLLTLFLKLSTAYLASSPYSLSLQFTSVYFQVLRISDKLHCPELSWNSPRKLFLTFAMRNSPLRLHHLLPKITLL